MRNKFKFIYILIIFFSFISNLAASSKKSKNENLFPMTTEVYSSHADTYFIYHNIEEIVLINMDKPSQKVKLTSNDFSYDKKIGRINFLNPLPFLNCKAEIKGEPVTPYSCYLNDFEGYKNELLVILNNMVATEKKDYVLDSSTNIITFRPDIDILHSSYHMVYYVQTANGVVAKTISNDSNDTIAELQARHTQMLFGGPLVIYKDRTGVSLKQVSKEAGFKINLPKPDTISLCETYENNIKTVVVYCFYKDKIVECQKNKTVEYYL